MVRVIQRQWMVLEEREGGLLPGSPEAVAAIHRVGTHRDGPNAGNPDGFRLWPDELRAAFYRGEYHHPIPGYTREQGTRQPVKLSWSIHPEQRQTVTVTRSTAIGNMQRTKPQTCKECGCDISMLPTLRIRCDDCRIKAKQVASMAYYERHRAQRVCLRCKVDIAALKESRVLCDDCQRAKNDERTRKRHNKPSTKPPKLCADCGVDISHRHALSVRCHMCAEKAIALEHKTRRARKRAEAKAARQVSA